MYLEVGAASEGNGELGVVEGGSGDRGNSSSDTELVALLFEAEADVDWLDEVGTLGGSFQLQGGLDTGEIPKKD